MYYKITDIHKEDGYYDEKDDIIGSVFVAKGDTIFPDETINGFFAGELFDAGGEEIYFYAVRYIEVDSF